MEGNRGGGQCPPRITSHKTENEYNMRLRTFFTNMISDERLLTALAILGLIMSTIDGVHNMLLHMALIG